jgi:hypothetical protein
MENTRLNRLLLSVLGSAELVDQWWVSPNRAFDSRTPAEMFDIDTMRVVNYILDQIH